MNLGTKFPKTKNNKKSKLTLDLREAKSVPVPVIDMQKIAETKNPSRWKRVEES